MSYWEYDSWFARTDFTLIGSGIVGICCALRLRELHPGARITIIEKGVLPLGASTRNAGFACFGSISELLTDLEVLTEEEVQLLVRKRWEGIQRLRSLLGDAAIDFQSHGGHEVFLEDADELYSRCLDRMEALNHLLLPVFGQKPFSVQPNRFDFRRVKERYISHSFEGQIDTGRMMRSLINRAQKEGIQLVNGLGVLSFEETNGGVRVFTEQFELVTHRLLVTTNGFAAQLLQEEVLPARAQVLITEPIADLKVQGTFHIDRGYYYFRNIHNRILIGGGRNLDISGETTVELGQTALIQDRLEQLLKEVILPGIPFEVSRRWSGIMGVGPSKQPLVKQISDRIFCGVRLGGMGIAIGSLVGAELADLASGKGNSGKGNGIS